MKTIHCLILALLLVCLLCACAAPKDESASTTTETKESVHSTQPTQIQSNVTPTESPVEVAREMIRNGEYQDAEALLLDVAGDEAEMLRLRAKLGDVAVGDEILFGRFEQDDDKLSGPEEIQWIVIEKKGDMVLLLSRFCLDTQPYHNKNGSVTWEECLMRTWLNGEFCDAAFTPAEQMMLVETELVNQDNSLYGTPGGANTVDRVFLLSVDEVKIYLSRPQRYAQVTPYADGRDCYSTPSGYAYWWLRTPGAYSRDAVDVGPNGEYNLYGYVVNRNHRGVRPAVWIDLSV